MSSKLPPHLTQDPLFMWYPDAQYPQTGPVGEGEGGGREDADEGEVEVKGKG